MELTLSFNLGDRIQVRKGKFAGKTGIVAGFDGAKVLVQSEAYPDLAPKPFDAEWLRLFDAGEPCPPDRQTDALDAGEPCPPPTETEDQGDRLGFLDHPFPLTAPPAKLRGTVVSRLADDLGNGCSPIGNAVPQDSDIALLEHLIYKYYRLAESDTLRDRWLHEEVSEARTRYRLRWREQGKLKSKEITKEEWKGCRERISRGQLLGQVRSLIRSLLAEMIGHDTPGGLERQRAIEGMIEGRQPIATILATVGSLPMDMPETPGTC
jgi:hypothetical protein